MTAIDLISGPRKDLEARVHALEERVVRERARSAGLEQGIASLTERIEALRIENLELRRRLELQD